MDRRKFLGSMFAAGSLAALGTVEASSLFRMEDSDPSAIAKRKKMDEELVVLISDLHCNPDGYQPEYLKKVVSEILAMKPLPANVIALGDLAYLTGQPKEYARLKEVISPIEDAGIKLTLAMGNHDRRKEFAEAFPKQAARTKVPGRYVYIVETPNADIIVLDSLQEGEDNSTWITPGALNSEQVEWLDKTLQSYKKPVFVSAHHPINETKINKVLLKAPTCCGYIYGHNHIWNKYWFKDNYSSTRLVRTLCMPSTGHWGDIGYTTFKLGKDQATATLHERDFFFPKPAEDPKSAPEQWKLIVADQDGSVCTFKY